MSNFFISGRYVIAGPKLKGWLSPDAMFLVLAGQEPDKTSTTFPFMSVAVISTEAPAAKAQLFFSRPTSCNLGQELARQSSVTREEKPSILKSAAVQLADLAFVFRSSEIAHSVIASLKACQIFHERPALAR